MITDIEKLNIKYTKLGDEYAKVSHDLRQSKKAGLELMAKIIMLEEENYLYKNLFYDLLLARKHTSLIDLE